MKGHTLRKEERLCSKKIIDKMFEGRSKSFSVFPLRVVYMEVSERDKTTASVLVSVSKRKFRRAVKRNKIKRRIREAYRKNKYTLLDALDKKEYGLAIAFIYLSDEMPPYTVIEEKMKLALVRIAEKLE